VEIHARVGGYLIAADFEEGKEVEKGNVLFRIDPRPFEAALGAAKATVARWDATLAKAKADLERNRKLAASEAVSQEELELSIAEVKVAEAELLGSKEAVRRAELDLEYTTIKAPITGRTSRKMVSVGNLVAPGSTTAPLTTMVSVNPVYAYFPIDEPTLLAAQRQAAMQAKKGDGAAVENAKLVVEIALGGSKEYTHKGTINFADNRIDPDTGTLMVRAVFDNADRRLVPGMFARVRVSLSEPSQSVLVEERAIGTDLNQKFVYVVNRKNQVEYRKVTLGPKQEDGYVVVREGTGEGEGITQDDRVIVLGVQRVRPGMTVRPQLLKTVSTAKP